MSFSRNSVRKGAFARVLSPLVLAAVAGMAVHAPAMAAKKDKEKEQAAPKASYSKGFVAAYKPVETIMAAPAPDYAAAKAAIPSIVAAAETPDDKMAAGRMLYTVGQKTQDYQTAIQGIDLVLGSGRADPTMAAQFAFVGGQMAYNLKDYARSRTFYQAAIDGGYTDNDPPLALAAA